MNSTDLRNRASELAEVCRLLVERAKEMSRIADVLQEEEQLKISKFEKFRVLYTQSKEDLSDYDKGFLDGLDNAVQLFDHS